MKYKRSLCWFRRDLRLSDHVALSQAIRQSETVFLLFVFDTNILNKLKDKDDRRVSFIADSLRELEKSIESKNSALIVRYGDPVKEIAKVVQELKIEAVFVNRDYEPNAKARDEQVLTKMKSLGVAFNSNKDQVIFEHPEILTQQGTPFKVFTPYKNAWLKEMREEDCLDFSCKVNRLAPKKDCRNFLWEWSLEKIGFVKNSPNIQPGEKGAKSRFQALKKNIQDYDIDRDFPAITNGTSGLSIHLRFGTISIRALVRFAMNESSQGAKTWLSELIWRDFYQTILDCFPYAAKGSFKPAYDRIKWEGNPKHFKLWVDGMTGYPIVDAAMRHFKRTGWMHNRLRMIVASFLTKDLLIDWRKGEAWFARNLLDFDLAANNGGWQWAASTGCDAQPYFRIFNPITQSKRFDPKGDFIKSEIPELRMFSSKNIHWPIGAKQTEQSRAGCVLGKDYPLPIVDHALQRKLAINMYEKAKIKNRN